ncbi:hypothetical protein CRUP_012297 [Coryphaenoides rupestris]|nr:hypothetical protein CRUP_012297 [Coryphaenoides rupestris]
MLGLYLSVLFPLYLVPLGMYSPCIKEAGTLGPPPSLIGHKGAPMLAPENTVLSFEKAVEVGGAGLETDVRISYDGVPFLMHDSTLRRTTDVGESDPFGTGSSLSESERSSIQNQSIPSLAQFLEVAADSGRLVLFDLRRPPSGHPYNVSYINTTLQVVLTHINSSQVNMEASCRLRFQLKSAYDCSLMPFTNYTYDFKGVIDYIFSSRTHLTTLGVLGPLDTQWLQDNSILGCPHPHIPSDHFSLLAQLELAPPLTHPLNGLHMPVHR